MNKIHTEVNVKQEMKVVISLRNRQFNGIGDVESAIAAIDYSAKRNLRLRGNVTGSGVIMGNVMILDLYIPLHTTNSHDVSARFDEFNRENVRNLISGVYHSGNAKTYGNFGALNVGYVSQNPTPVRDVTIRVETLLSNSDIRSTVENLGGRVIEVSDTYNRNRW